MINQKVMDAILRLIDGTKKGAIVWNSESPEGDSFLADLGPGKMRISQGVAFRGESNGPLIVEFLDAEGRTLSQHRAETVHDYPAVSELFQLVRNQALDADETMSRIFEEIKRRSG